MKRLIKLILFISVFIPLACFADIAVIVNVNNPSSTLSVSELKNIYRVRISQFYDNNPITLSYQSSDSEITQQFFLNSLWQSQRPNLNGFGQEKYFQAECVDQ